MTRPVGLYNADSDSSLNIYLIKKIEALLNPLIVVVVDEIG